MKVIGDILASKYGKHYADACREESIPAISEKVKHKMSVQSPSKILVEKYLMEIAKNFNVEYEPDPQIMAQENDTNLIEIGNSGGELPNNLELASGGAGGTLLSLGFIGFPQAPMLPQNLSNMDSMVIILLIPSIKLFSLI